MNLTEFLKDGGFSPEVGELLAPWWREDPALEPMPEFLDGGFFREYEPLLGLRESPASRVDALVAEVKKHPALRIYANLLDRWLLGGEPGPDGARLPLPVGRLGEEGAGLFSLLLALAALPRIRKSQAELGLPESCWRGVAGWIAGTVTIYKAAHDGFAGTNLQQIHWLRFSIERRLFRVGRFEYLVHTVPDWVPAVYRSRADGGVLALCRDDWRIDGGGFRVEEGGERTFLEWDGSMLTGTPIDPASGRALPGVRRTIDLEVYEPVLTPHEWVPSVHIPGGGGMTAELAGASLREAAAFFRKYFKKEIRAFVCDSWILNPAWMELLPESNLAAFMRELYLFPRTPYPQAGLFFVFGRSDGDFASYPADTSLRRAFHRLYNAGEPFRTGGMFVLTADLDRWGGGLYRSR